MTDKVVQAFLVARGKTGIPLMDYMFTVDDNDAVNFTLWNVATLGPVPTVAEIAAMKTAGYQASSRDKDTLAIIALIVRAKGLAAWNGMTVQQKVTATLAEADVWTTIRDFIETNIP
jgi:hypothetical protein